MYFLPAKLFSTQLFGQLVAGVGEQRERQAVLLLELRVRALVVGLTPSTTAPRCSNSLHASRIPQGCFVHPGVSSRG